MTVNIAQYFVYIHESQKGSSICKLSLISTVQEDLCITAVIDSQQRAHVRFHLVIKDKHMKV